MRLFLLLLISVLAFASEYPRVFSSAGDEIYEDMAKYEQIKDLDIYQDRPELLEAFLEDAKVSLVAGFELDKAEDDPEVNLDKQALKDYARALRDLSKQNENIKEQIKRDMKVLLEAKDSKHLKVFESAGFSILNKSISTFKEKEAEEKFIAWLAVICNRAVSHYLKKQFISIINDNSADEYQQFIGSLQMDSRWELYDTVVWKIRDSKAKPGKNLERDINIFLLYLWGDFSIEMITSNPCYRDIGPRVIDNVVNRLRILLKM